MPKRHQRTHTDFVAQCRSVVSSAARSYRSSHGPRGYRCNVFVHPCHRTDPALTLSLSLRKKENKNEGLPGTMTLPACLRRRTSALGIRFEGNVRVMGPSMESCHNHHRWRRKRTQTHTLTRTHSFHESRRRPTPLRSQTDRWYNTASGLIS